MSRVLDMGGERAEYSRTTRGRRWATLSFRRAEAVSGHIHWEEWCRRAGWL